MSNYALLGSPVSAEYDPMRTAACGQSHAGAGGSNGAARSRPPFRTGRSEYTSEHILDALDIIASEHCRLHVLGASLLPVEFKQGTEGYERGKDRLPS